MGKLGENIVVAGAERYDDGGTIAAYVHPPANKIGVLVDLDGGDEALARQLAMHISFAAPEWATRDDVPPEAIEAERQVYLNSDEVLSKPEAAREKIVDGMLGKRFFAASPGGVLVDQAWIHDQSKSVGAALAGGRRDAEGLQAGLGRRARERPVRRRGRDSAGRRWLAVSPRAAEALGREPDGRPRLRRRPEDGLRDRPRGRRGAEQRHRARDRGRRRQLLPRHGRGGRRDGPRDGRLRRHARDAAERARAAGRAREARRARRGCSRRSPSRRSPSRTSAAARCATSRRAGS